MKDDITYLELESICSVALDDHTGGFRLRNICFLHGPQECPSVQFSLIIKSTFNREPGLVLEVSASVDIVANCLVKVPDQFVLGAPATVFHGHFNFQLRWSDGFLLPPSRDNNSCDEEILDLFLVLLAFLSNADADRCGAIVALEVLDLSSGWHRVQRNSKIQIIIDNITTFKAVTEDRKAISKSITRLFNYLNFNEEEMTV